MAASRVLLLLFVVAPISLVVISRVTGYRLRSLLPALPGPLLSGVAALAAVTALRSTGLLDNVAPAFAPCSPWASPAPRRADARAGRPDAAEVSAGGGGHARRLRGRRPAAGSSQSDRVGWPPADAWSCSERDRRDRRLRHAWSLYSCGKAGRSSAAT